MTHGSVLNKNIPSLELLVIKLIGHMDGKKVNYHYHNECTTADKVLNMYTEEKFRMHITKLAYMQEFKSTEQMQKYAQVNGSSK